MEKKKCKKEKTTKYKGIRHSKRVKQEMRDTLKRVDNWT